MEQFHGFLMEKEKEADDGKKSMTSAVAISALFEEFSGTSCQHNKRPPESVLDSAVKKRKETRGEKKIDGRNHFRSMTGDEKISFLNSVYDDEHNACCNEDRQFLLRAKSAAHCYRVCCANDAAIFKSKHGVSKGKSGWTFHLANIKGCAQCLKM